MSTPCPAALARVLEILRLEHWLEPMLALQTDRMSPSAHGDFERWQAAVSGLRSASDDAERRALLMRLAP